MRASTTLMVPNDQLTRVAGLNYAIEGIGRVVAPSLASLLLELMSIQWRHHENSTMFIIGGGTSILFFVLIMVLK